MADLDVRINGRASTVIREADLAAFNAEFRGQVLDRGHVSYDNARAIWNGMIDNRPALIAVCQDATDVARAVNFARDQDLLISVRGGGHNVAGKSVCDDGLMIDLSHMTNVHVEPKEHTVRAEAGALLGDLDRETQKYGLAVPAGTVSETGIAGLTLGGGIGWLARKHGLTCDNLIEAELVTARGEVVRANETENADLLWGLKGEGGNFGIVTSFKYRAYSLGTTVLAGSIHHPIERAREFLRFFSEFITEAPDELTTIPTVRMLAPVASIPEELQGTKVAGVSICWSGDIEAGESALKPLKEYGSPLMDTIGPKKFVEFQTIFDAGAPAGHMYYQKTENLPALNAAVIDVLAGYGETVTSPWTMVGLFQLGGAVSRIDNADAVYADRDAAYSLVISASWQAPDDSERHITWAREFWNAIHPHSTGGVYVNFLDDEEGDGRLNAAYGDEKRDRLVDLKNRYDPSNFFRLNHNIKTATTGGADSAQQLARAPQDVLERTGDSAHEAGDNRVLGCWSGL